MKKLIEAQNISQNALTSSLQAGGGDWKQVTTDQDVHHLNTCSCALASIVVPHATRWTLHVHALNTSVSNFCGCYTHSTRLVQYSNIFPLSVTFSINQSPCNASRFQHCNPFSLIASSLPQDECLQSP
jgi:hypothetical protein